MRLTGAVAGRVVLLVAIWVVLGRALGLIVGQTPDATITASVAATTLWFAGAGALALADGRADRLATHPYAAWLVVTGLASLGCIVWQWASASVSAQLWDGARLVDDLLVLTPGLLTGSALCALIGLALGRRDAAVQVDDADDRDDAVQAAGAPAGPAQRPLTRSATRAIHDVVETAPLSSRRSAAR